MENTLLVQAKTQMDKYPVVSVVLSSIAGIVLMMTGLVLLLDISMSSTKPFLWLRLFAMGTGSAIVLLAMIYSIYNIRVKTQKAFYLVWVVLMALPSLIAVFLLCQAVTSIPFALEYL